MSGNDPFDNPFPEPGIGSNGLGGGITIITVIWDNVGAIVAALQSLIQNLSDLLDTLKKVLTAIGNFLSRVWREILKPLLARIEALITKLHRIYNRIIRPILIQIERQRQAIRRIYEIYFRPILETIQALRAFLALTHLNNTAFGRALDRRLGRLESKIAAPILVALKTINDQAYLLNLLLTPEYIFQSWTHLRSIVHDAGAISRVFWNMGRGRAGVMAEAVLAAIPATPAPATERADFKQLLTSNTGALAAELAADRTAFRQSLAAS